MGSVGLSLQRRGIGRSIAVASAMTMLGASLQIAGVSAATAAEGEDPPPALGGQLYSTGTPVEIEVLSASAGLTSTLFLLEPEEVRVATNRDVGTKVEVGPYPQGEELVFGIRVSGQEFRLGPGTRNPDGLEHAVVDFGPDGCAIVGFEDLFGGGDRDYDDNRFRFCGGVAPDPEEPPTPPAPTPYEPPTADAGPDQEVDEGSVVTLDGSASQASSRPGLEASEKSGALPGGTSIGAEIAGLDPETTDGLRMIGAVDVGEGPPVQNTSLAYVIDVSGSANFGGGCGGDANGDGRANLIIDCEIAAALELHKSVVEAGTVEKVAVVRFSSGASAVDLDPTAGSAQLVSPTADVDNDGVLDVEEALRSLRAGGGTNFAAAAKTTCSILATTGSPKLLSAFLSDGQSSGAALSTVVPCNPPVQFESFAVGTSSKCNLGSTGRRLDDLASLSGGTCTNVPDIGDLPNILPSVISSRITKVEYRLDDGDPVDISDTLGLPVEGPGELDVAVDLPSSLTAGEHQVCLIVTGEDAGGSSSETTCSKLVAVTGELSYRWSQVSSEGATVLLSSRASVKPSFVAPDDGSYVFELTVTDAAGATATDRVRVTVRNVAPELLVEPGDSFAGGVTQVNGSFTDAGWVDTHDATVVWGDGTTDTVPVTAQGSGWGTFFGSHVYTEPGSYDVSVVLRDDDGGDDVKALTSFEVQSPVAVWANSTTAKSSLDWSGASGAIDGRVHSNGQLRFVGAAKTVVGPTTHAGQLSADTTRNSFVPAPSQSEVQDFPYAFDIADYRPDGRVAREVGEDYHDMSAACGTGSWHEVQTVLEAGVYYADCDIKLNGSDIGGRVTLVSEGHVSLSGSRPEFEPYLDGLLILAGAEGDKAIDLAASSSKFLGVLFAGAGEIDISGSSNRFFCGILGDRVDITGGDTRVRGAMCGRPDSTVSGPLLVPDFNVDMQVDRPKALPSETLGYTVRLSNDGATLVVPSLIGLENVDTGAATVDGYEFSVQRLDVTTDSWVPVATLGDEPVQVDVRANPFTGVTYPADGGVEGTTVPAGGWATWGLQAVLELSPEQVTALLDPAQTGGVRTRVDFRLSPGGVQARRLYTYGADFATALRDLSADVTDPAATLLPPDGDAVQIDTSIIPELASLTPGESVEVEHDWDLPVPAPRGAGETDAGYLSRLLSLDGTPLNAATFALASGGVGRLTAPLSKVSTEETLPVIGISAKGPDSVAAGTTADYRFPLANLGSASAGSIDVAATAGTESLTLTGVPTTLTKGELAEAEGSHTAPADSPGGPLPVRGESRWSDELGNTYGATAATLDAVELAPATLNATLTDELHDDVADDGVVSPGDTVRYALTVRNTGGVPLGGVQASVPLDPHSTIVPGSPAVGSGGTVTRADDVVEADLPAVNGSGQQTLTFDVVVAEPFPKGVSRLQVQGTVSADGFDAKLTDDPVLPGAADATRTSVVVPNPALTAFLTGRLVVDADGSGDVSPGDTLGYQMSVSSVGTQEVTGVHAVVEPPAGTSLVAGSVASTQGTVTGGDRVDVAIGALAPFQEATVDFRLQVASPLPAGVTRIGVAGTVLSDQLEPVTTDDPSTYDVGDSTTLPIGDPGQDPEKPAPVVSAVTPEDGSVVTTPTTVSATLTPPDGESVTSWRITATRVGTDATRELGRSPSPLAPDAGPSTLVAAATETVATAALDPTVLPNGIYQIRVTSTSSAGGTSTSTTSAVVDGQLKLGRYTTAVADHEVGLAGLPLQVIRSYDSFDKATGDFGVGWNVDIADFEIATATPLGLKGWTAKSGTCGLIFCNIVYTSTVPHYVTVVWPDGRQEMFDLKPTEGSTFFSGLSSATFEPRPGTGTTSSLEVAGDNSLFFHGDGNANGGAFGSGGIFDPTQFRLTDRAGTEYLLDRTKGLQKVTDRSGNTLTFSHNGVVSSQGKSVIFTRDDKDRIETITSPAGQTSYTYTPDGDLGSVTDAGGDLVEYTYTDDHNLTGSTGEVGTPLESVEYHPDGRMAAIIDGEGNRLEVTSDPGARTQVTRMPGGREVITTTFDEVGNRLSVDRVFDGKSHLTRYEYNDLNLPTLREDPNGNTWQAEYDDLGRPLVLTDARGKTTTFAEWTEFSLPREITDEAGQLTKLAYDGTSGLLTSVIDPEGNTEQWTYNADGTVKTYRDGSTKADGTHREWSYTYEAGNLATETDPAGKVTRFEFSEAGLQEAVEDPSGVRTEYEYDPYGFLRFVRLPLGRTTEYRYNDRGELTHVVDGEGRATIYGYDDAGRLVTETNSAGERVTYTHNARGQVLTTLNAEDETTSYVYDGGGRLTSYTDGIDRGTHYTWDDADRLSSTTEPNGSTTEYRYDPNGRVDQIIDALGGETAIIRDDTGRIRSVEDPLGHTSEYGYDRAGRLTSVTDALGHSVRYGHDAADRIVSETDPLDHSSTYAYDDAGRLALETDAEGRSTRFSYGDAGLLTEVRDGRSRSTSLTYDEGGWLESVTSAGGATSAFTWDRSGLLQTLKAGDNPVASYAYNPAGRIRALTDPRGNSTTWGYDDAGRVETETDELGGVVGYGYDDAGQLTTITDPLSRVTTLGYDALGNLASREDALGRTWTWTYDALGRPDVQTDAKGNVVDVEFDAASRIDKVTTPAGVIDHTYDPADRLEKISDATGDVEWTWDDADRITAVASPAGTIGYGWDDSGLLTRMALPQGDVERSFDQAGGIDRVTDWTGAWTDYDVNGDGQPAGITRSNGVSTAYRYDTAGRLDQVSHTGSDGLIERYTYTLDPNGNRVGETSDAGDSSFTLDELERITAATYPDGRSARYSYFADGSRKSATENGETTDYVYDDAGQLASTSGPDGTVSYEYDAHGNRTRAGSDTFGYDWANRLTAADVGGESHEWTYDGQGLRATADGVPQLWDRLPSGPGEVEHLVGAGDTAYVHDPFGGLSSSVAGGATSWALTDALGSTRALTDAAGAVAGSTSYDAFGAVADSTGTQAAFGFTGEQTDPAGMLHLRARGYDTASGQFLQPDALLRSMPGTIGVNRYAYVGNNPTTWIDPTGHMAIEYRALLGSVSARAVAGRALGQCAAGALTDVAIGLGISLATGGASLAGTAVDAVSGCITGGRSKASGAGDAGRGATLGSPVAPGGRQFGDPSPTTSFPEIKPGSAGGTTKGKKFPESVRQEELKNNPSTCVYCRMETDNPQIDHVIPRSRGGDATIDNAQTTCPHCNASKGARDVPVTPPKGYEGPWPPPWWPKP